ncbi:RagB/SusD family nutrient uptake outer membrane protein [Mariniflexile sp. HNIBRBA6329]|uniref:RagB/SusD family nutrient uptake outer membrane protein n=1 Tax=Mariniflexile sp. HNIBRBA6329 TaxID=3373088 RepID=UPI00374545CF
MKNIKSILLLIAVLSTSFGCKDTLEDLFDDALTDEPKNQFTQGQVFSTPQGLETAVNGMYYDLQAFDYYGARFHLLIWPHSGKFHSNQGSNNDATGFATQNTNDNLDKLWAGMYQTVNTINSLIANVENTELPNRDTALGQAYFLRGLTYYNMVRFFGEVPLRITPTSTETLNIAKSPKEDVFNQVFKDFKLASQLLPNRGEYLVGRPIKYAANAYMADAYMWLAGREQADPNYIDESKLTEVNSTNFWVEAKDQLDIVINLGGYSLTQTYAQLWEEGNENTSESILELQYGNTGAARTSALLRDVSLQDGPTIPAGAQAFSRIKPNKEMFSDHIIQYSGLDYTGQNFIPAGNNAAIITLNPAVADPRIDATYIYNSYTRTNNGSIRNLFPRQSGNSNFARAFLNKYPDQTYNSTTQATNHIIMRYADILLRRAEVENEINGPASAYQYVNKVLLRARTTATGTTIQPADWNATSVPTKEVFRERIMKEREYELCGEGYEWYDVRRRGINYLQKQVDHHNAAVVFYNSTGGNSGDFILGNVEKEMTLPIPLSEISGNNLISN